MVYVLTSSADFGVQALLQLGRKAEAETELLSIASSDDAPLELCTSALAAMLEVPGLSGTVASAAALVLKRQPGVPQLPVQLVELILNKADSKVRAALASDIILQVRVLRPSSANRENTAVSCASGQAPAASVSSLRLGQQKGRAKVDKLDRRLRKHPVSTDPRGSWCRKAARSTKALH